MALLSQLLVLAALKAILTVSVYRSLRFSVNIGTGFSCLYIGSFLRFQ